MFVLFCFVCFNLVARLILSHPQVKKWQQAEVRLYQLLMKECNTSREAGRAFRWEEWDDQGRWEGCDYLDVLGYSVPSLGIPMDIISSLTIFCIIDTNYSGGPIHSLCLQGLLSNQGRATSSGRGCASRGEAWEQQDAASQHFDLSVLTIVLEIGGWPLQHRWVSPLIYDVPVQSVCLMGFRPTLWQHEGVGLFIV